MLTQVAVNANLYTLAQEVVQEHAQELATPGSKLVINGSKHRVKVTYFLAISATFQSPAQICL